MEFPTTSIIVPSLLQATAFSLTVEFWKMESEDGVRNVFKFNSEYQRGKQFEATRERILQKINKLLFLPKPVREVLINSVEPIGLQIIRAVRFYRFVFPKTKKLERDLVNGLQWIHETVDKRRTAELFLENEDLDVDNRYKLACKCCCEKLVTVIWNQMPESYVKYLYSSTYLYVDDNYRLAAFWTARTRDELTGLANVMCPGRNMFDFLVEFSVTRGNELAVEYFWNKLSEEERDGRALAFANLAVEYNCTHILRFFLDKMNSTEKNDFFRGQNFKLLKCLFNDQLLHDCLVPVAKMMLNSLAGGDFLELLFFLTSKIDKNLTSDYYKYQKMFEELWTESPDNLKTHVVGNCWVLLWKLIDAENLRSLKLILDAATADEKKQLVYSVKGMKTCDKLILDGCWKKLNVFLGLTLASKQDERDFLSLLVNRKENSLCCRLICDDKLENLDVLLSLSNSTREADVYAFKTEVLLFNRGEYICTKLMTENDWDWSLVERFFKWVFNLEDCCKEYSTGHFENATGMRTLFTILIFEDRMDLVKKFVKSCFFTRKEVDDFASELSIYF